ncbi:hypothetical protein EG240_04170 [Paenimyroides tangerinum]|uniref:Uncharacterized protein n=1 Tax=Paenimyroides tangerinum TaxID=2488728 RepID=A0A3P3WCE5_9FLAO|nr:hypothetical protein [Paenimyroides tangerinum]RRJ91987.1 hypothetical protein EG240_04170 [Paenimyroides tangerinum]
MVKFSLLLFACLIAQENIIAQDFPYKLSKDIIAEKDSNQNAFALQIAATNFAFQGDYRQALKTWNEQRPNQKEIKLTEFDSLFLAKSKVISAKEYILEKSKEEEIIILNELHHNSSHRKFARSLLKGLYDNGYRYLGLEALDDNQINDRKFATIESGYYTSEPEFGNFIKEALDLGFTLFGYEASETDNWDTDKWKNREIAQAQNIYKFMQNHTDGKYFIYCGAGHAFEGDNNGRGKSMAGVLSDLTKINPLTIDQNRYSDKGENRYNQPLTKLVQSNVPSILINSEETIFRSNSTSYETDISIIQPIINFEKIDSSWLNDNVQIEVEIPTEKTINYPALLLIYRKGELKMNGIPTKIIELANNQKKIFVKKGNYDYLIIDSKNNKIHY